jgi:predicted nucleotidyltransferase
VALPPLTDAGELPLGVHRASLREILDQFGVGSAQRKVLALRLDRVHRVAEATNHLARFVVFGSFVTNKLEPQDVDVFLVMEDTFDASQLAGDASLLFDHAAAQAHFGASVFWVRHRAAWPNEQAAIEFWQVKRGGGRRGIVAIIAEAP